MAFIFGGNTNVSYEDMMRQRALANAYASEIGNPKTIGEGLTALGKGLASGLLNRSANKAEKAGKEAAQQRFQSVLGTLFGQSLGGGMTSFADPQAQQAQDPQAPMVEQTDPAVSGAFAGKSDLSGLPPSLIQSESGGSWSALNSEGYGGRGQFGTDRLADAARAGVIPAGMTGADYSRQPGEVQQRVEQWHRGDVMKDLGQYVGTDVDGAGPIPPLTENSLLAVAHLGGKGGAKRFVESGGRYNPSDSNGTSLADYATRHAGGAAMGGGAMQDPMAGMDMSAVMGALSDPYLDEGSRSVIGMMLQQRLGQQAAIRDQQMRMQDPAYQMGLAKSALEIQQLQNPQPERQPLMNAGGGSIYDPNSGQWIIAPRGPSDAQSAIGKLAADRAAGLISEEEYQTALAKMAPTGMTIESDGQGNFRMVQGAGAGDNTRPFTEAQSKDVGFATRMRGAEEAFSPVQGELTSAGNRALDADPTGLLRGGLQGEDYQLARQAGQEWLLSFLRKDSGAATTKDEDSLYGAVFLPRPGDSDAVIAQKAAARDRAMRAVEAGMSPSQIVAQERALRKGEPQQPDAAPSQPKRLRFNPQTGELE